MTNECLRTYQNGYKKMYVAITNVFFSFSLTVILLFLSRQFSFMFGWIFAEMWAADTSDPQ